MGACFGRCLTIKRFFRLKRSTNNDDQNVNLVEESNTGGLVYRIMKNKPKKHSKFIERFWARNDIKNYSRLQKPANIPSTSDIQLQSLDAQSLLVTARDRNTTFRPDMYTGLTSSPASSSLDLEWEHEYEGQTQSWLALPEELTINENSSDENDCSSTNSEFQPTKENFDTKKINCSKYRKVSYNNNTTANVSWSHISTPDSLEWDVDPGDLDDDDSLDQDTKDLLNEIELLKNTVLNETGDTIRLDNEAES